MIIMTIMLSMIWCSVEKYVLNFKGKSPNKLNLVNSSLKSKIVTQLDCQAESGPLISISTKTSYPTINWSFEQEYPGLQIGDSSPAVSLVYSRASTFTNVLALYLKVKFDQLFVQQVLRSRLPSNLHI